MKSSAVKEVSHRLSWVLCRALEGIHLHTLYLDILGRLHGTIQQFRPRDKPLVSQTGCKDGEARRRAPTDDDVGVSP